jgi:ABC-type glycerol-3-phosphate transport system substrate-binding protein
MMVAMLAGCGGNTTPATPTVSTDPAKNTDPTNGTKVAINEEIYNKLAAEYRFDLNEVQEKQNSGKMEGTIYIDRAFLAEMSGWEYVTEAYSALYPDVEFELHNHASGKDMATAISTPMAAGAHNIGIMQGNYVKNDLKNYGYDFQSGILDEINPYAGVGEDGEGLVWSDVMSDQLLEIGAASSNLLVSQETVTGIYINTSALVEAGVVDADGKAKLPTTWNEMMDACAALKKAGYTAPFAIGEMTGVAMEWVIKVYADQCYRDLLDDVQQQVGDFNYKQAAADFSFSLSDIQPEYDSKYNINTMRVYNALLNKNGDSPYYVGAGSDKFNCYMSNLMKISQYLSPTFAEETITAMQQNFLAGTKDSPVFMPCYLGFGVSIMNTEGVDFEWDVIDYVPMECTCNVPCNQNGGCDHVDNDATHNECTKHIRATMTRDVGGYGGYIGLYTYGKSEEQIDLYLDFIQFFLSPYGQSCFYYGLENGGGSPKATSGIIGTVAPEAWDSIFEAAEKVVFSGRAAENPFVQYLTFGHANYDSYTSLRTATGNALRKGGADALKSLISEWESSLLSTYQSFFKTTYGKPTPYFDYTKNPNA